MKTPLRSAALIDIRAEASTSVVPVHHNCALSASEPCNTKANLNIKKYSNRTENQRLRFQPPTSQTRSYTSLRNCHAGAQTLQRYGTEKISWTADNYYASISWSPNCWTSTNENRRPTRFQTMMTHRSNPDELYRGICKPAPTSMKAIRQALLIIRLIITSHKPRAPLSANTATINFTKLPQWSQCLVQSATAI